MSTPNIVSITNIVPTSNVGLVTTGVTGILTCQSNRVIKINTLSVANIDGSSSGILTVTYYKSDITSAINIIDQVTIPANSTFVPISRDNIVYLNENDVIQIVGDANNRLSYLISYEEIY
jgi:hypothetical protein